MKYAVVGLGFMGSTHLQALKKIPQAELVAVVSDDPQALSGDLSAITGNLGRPGERMDFSNLRRYRNIEDVVHDQDVEAVDLCLPTNLHAPVAVAALQAGKHVLVEKPMALDGQSADEIVVAAEQAGRALMTAQVLRFWNSYQPLIEAARSGRLGPVCGALFRRRCAAPSWGRWLHDPSKGGGGVFDLLIHDVDMCLHLFGVPEAVSAIGFEDLPAGVDLISANFYYPDFGPVVITGGWHHPKSYPFSMEYTVSFEGGTMEYHSESRPVALYDSSGDAKPLEIPEMDAFQAEIEYFLDCAINGKRPERCPPEESAAAVKLARLMVEARKSNGEKIPCRL